MRGLIWLPAWAVLALTCARVLASAASPALAHLERLGAESGAPGVSAAVAVRGEIVFSAGVGVSDLENGTLQSGRSVHNIGSISKTQGVVAVMQLVERGKVKLDEPIQTYAPWFPRKQRTITVRQLLTHTSGIRHYKEGEFGPGDVQSFRQYESFEESTRFWRDDPLLFMPGQYWGYSSYATSLIQAIVESASGQPFERYLSEQVWRPAGMVDTQFDVPARIVPRRGHGYLRNRKTGQLEHAPEENVSYKYAGGGVISTDEDLCRFGHALNAGRLLRRDSLAELYRLQLSPDLPIFPELQAQQAAARPDVALPRMSQHQALIFAMDRDVRGRPYARHAGKVKGTASMFFNFYEDDVVVALHLNFNEGGVDTKAAAETLAQLFLQVRSR
jgi:CubicO group peptidase (beta-lactamase class C family)